MQLLSGVCDSDDIRFVYFCFIYFNIHIYLGSERVLKRAEIVNGINSLNYRKKKKLQERKTYSLVKHQLSKGIIISTTWKVKIICHPSHRLPWWLRGWSVCLQCGRPRLDPWVGKIHWKRKWQLTPVFLPRESPWTEEPGGLQSIGLQRVGHDWAKELDMTERLHFLYFHMQIKHYQPIVCWTCT